jgi:hypothetical protein
MADADQAQAHHEPLRSPGTKPCNKMRNCKGGTCNGSGAARAAEGQQKRSQSNKANSPCEPYVGCNKVRPRCGAPTTCKWRKGRLDHQPVIEEGKSKGQAAWPPKLTFELTSSMAQVRSPQQRGACTNLQRDERKVSRRKQDNRRERATDLPLQARSSKGKLASTTRSKGSLCLP